MVRAPIGETVDTRDELELRLAIGQDAVMAEAEVVRVDDVTNVGPDVRPMAAAKSARPPRTMIAVRFVTISEDAQDRIVRHIFALQRKRR